MPRDISADDLARIPRKTHTGLRPIGKQQHTHTLQRVSLYQRQATDDTDEINELHESSHDPQQRTSQAMRAMQQQFLDESKEKKSWLANLFGFCNKAK